jgi:23S rRNA pseudouridine2605 synthase
VARPPDRRRDGGSTEPPDGERLQKVMAAAGLGSRRTCEDLIAERRVTVNGEVARLGRRIDPVHDEVAVDGVTVGVAPGRVHYLLNKPAGVLTTADDPQGRPTVVDLVPAEPRVFPVGRLDMDTEGLLLLSNDGLLTHRLTHPSFGVEKEYVAHVEGTPSRQAIRRLREGVELEDGVTAPAQASLVAPSIVKLVIHEGRNRQVRRMCEAIGHPVTRLVRTRIGPLADRRLKPGRWRELTNDEVRALERAAGPEPSQG